MPRELIIFFFSASIILFWILVLRIVATLVNLDPYHPMTQVLYTFTDKILAPFRFGFLKRPSKIDLAVIPPLVILALIIILAGMNL